MRRYWRERQPRSIFRGAELPRLMTGLLMLVVIYMLIVRAREPATWAWLAKVDAPAASQQVAATTSDTPPADVMAEKNAKLAEKPADVKPADHKPSPAKPSNAPAPQADQKKPAEKLPSNEPAKEKVSPNSKEPNGTALLPPPSGPTDEDPEQLDEARNEFQALTDGTPKLGPEEMEAYDRLVEWVKNQSFAVLDKRATRGLWYTDLYDSPDKHRGQIVALEIEIRRANTVGSNRYGVPLWEAWGLTEESRGRLYDLIILDYPKQMPLGHNIYAKARFAGYFLKLQGYEPGSLKPGEPLDKAPVLIGRVEWVPPVVAVSPVDTRQEWIWGLALLAMIAVVFLLRAVYYRVTLKRKKSSLISPKWETTPGEVIPIESWLERAEFDDQEESRRAYPVEIESDGQSPPGKDVPP